MADQKMMPCPFCGSNKLVVRDGIPECDSCGAAGPPTSSLEVAIGLWNHRVVATKPVTREELAEAVREMSTALKQKSRRCSDCIHNPPDNNYVVEFCRTCTSAQQDNWKSKFLSRLDAEQSGVEGKHCELFTTKPSIPRDCQGDGHYECRNCGLLDPDSLMNRERTNPELEQARKLVEEARQNPTEAEAKLAAASE